MAIGAFDSGITGSLLSDPETAALFQDEAVIRAMLDVEGALALAEADAGLLTQSSADRIASVCRTVTIAPADLAEGTARDGVPVPVFVAELRKAVGPDHASFVHWGATSQDIHDTGLVLRLRQAIDLHEQALWTIAGKLADLADSHRATPIAARTRMQQATPTSFGLKAAVWLSSILRNIERLKSVRAGLLLLSFGGASGNLSALGAHATAVEAHLAERLSLAVSPAPWHAVRDGYLDYANWLALVTGTLGKIGNDLILLAQSEVAEIGLGSGGGSSTMPNKVNPVGPEVLVTLARNTIGLLANMHQSALHEHERGGASWMLEWLNLPQLAVATGAALAHANAVFDALTVNTERMRANIEASNGLLLAEAASFELAAHLPRPEAQALVKSACKTALESGRHLFDVLLEATDAPVDWEALKNPARHMGQSDAFITIVLESCQALRSD
ncbi:3-carboxy-cis,cis-muconate cycloisomerase [Roseibium aggregatum]|uniref:3-carboxy-cis,cis-muconate cycloisomerase n=1 Tax=Roseibium aggregatum TaxID=187304 RepID=A0A926P6F9_9HYPH|nr:3-carboxy-cis,cis-muconate cycloisomerase [Roseibium aggregatum]MBD1549371.1 3-carboxy-cis,cis-muconate cycloisomerase [Roseibium aggregatum]